MIGSIPSSAFLLVLGTVFYALMAFVLVRHRRAPGAAVTAFAMAACLIWVAGGLVSSLLTGLNGQVAAMSVGYVGACLAPTAILAFVVFYTRPAPLGKRVLMGLLAVPLATIALMFSNPLHELMWVHPPVDTLGNYTIRARWGPWFKFVHIPYQWGLACASCSLLFLASLRGVPDRPDLRPSLNRGQAGLLLGALAATFLVNIVVVTGSRDYPTSPTAVAIALCSVLFLWIFLQIELVTFRHVAHRRILNTLPEAVLMVDEHDRIVDLNPRAIELVQAGSAAKGKMLAAAFSSEPEMRALLSETDEIDSEVRLSNGRHYEARVSSVLDSRGYPRGRTVMLTDITERRLQERRLRSIVDVSPNGIVRVRTVCDDKGRLVDVVCTYANVAAGEYLGVDPSAAEGGSMLAELPAVGPQLLGVFQRCLDEGKDQRVEVPVAGPEDDPLWYRVIVSPVADELTITFIDVTREKNREAQMEAVAYTDPLTHILNRRGLETSFREWADEGRRESDARAILYLDLDRFKPVNDTYGHAAGDRLLKEFAARLRSVTRDGDLIARVGGDEFVVVLHDSDEEATETVVRRMIEVTTAPYWLNETAVTCRPSIGIFQVPAHGFSLEEGLVEADRAMYLAKATGSGWMSVDPPELPTS